MVTSIELGGITRSNHYLDLQRKLASSTLLEGVMYECLSTFESFGLGLLDHHMSVSRLSTGFAEAIRVEDSLVDLIRPAALIHDVGKIALPKDFLEKPFLTPKERQIMEKHVDLGVQLLRPIPSMREILAIIEAHHQYWNGLGYPANLQMMGSQIPLGARIIAIADHYAAATEKRPDRGPMQKDAALEEITRHSGTRFEPDLVNEFLKFMASWQQ
ncbi:hypothetical protein A2866_05690 [Candidatus Roizmanbacteria bacterium RIFCSPHIGHO2_01_FULL_39_8]|uniref:HD-GYP domain-containing protein n=3 Tax=Candidatus Roizmaniibacteriota TaxID=1752723 RepID=A0A1F7GNB1_9BACT|nr:MAG: hypothetical protein A2866_05690 [Candidatus Roizmanbacteria bacterium RIFCSPHIGHO2_01_FULL_39_8]OGK28435.1 MAG: hypothetical protein A3C28_02320 [Candidatus Roizmanbacteria bacterium RIFCSPHIGHO2_02_FULL_39_9]OGK35559.1 MAG: hypothetical protein A3F60_03985 [Candidatus Roizmanbacteria bacterium RIFCSPHIGHO2_12_FULL_39_8]